MGNWGEAETARFLAAQGWEVLAQNYRTPYGEIDLIVKKANELVFVEVKTRTSSSFGLPETSISQLKLRHMVESAMFYLQEHPEWDSAWRIDVAAVLRDAAGRPVIEVFENVTGPNAS